MKMIVFLIAAPLLVICGVVNTILFKKKINYANAFLLIWFVVTSLSAFGFYGFYIPVPLTYVYIFTMLIVFELSTVFLFIMRVNKKKARCKIEHKWNVYLVISLLCTIVLVPTFLISMRYALANGFYYLRIRILYNELFPARVTLILKDIIQPLIIVTAIVSIYEIVNNGKYRMTVLTSFINTALYILTLGNRWLILEIICIGLVIVIRKYSLNLTRMINENKKLIPVASGLFLMIVFITSQRSISGSTGFIYDAYSYFVGSVHFFGVAVANPAEFVLDGSSYLFGTEFFSAFISLFNEVLLTLKINTSLESGMTVINQITQQYFFVSPTTHMNNNITMVYGFLRDGGVGGLVVDTILLALFLGILYIKRNKNIYNQYMYIFGVSLIPFTIFEWVYGRTYVLSTFIFLIIFKWGRRVFINKKTSGNMIGKEAFK